jgi:hypothetical protein
MASKAERIFSQSLRTILAELSVGANIEHSDQFRNALAGLEFCLPELLGSEWHDEFDGFEFIVARKTGDRQAEMIGLCLLISDQTLTPIHLHIQIASKEDEVSWLDCKLGEKGKHGMVRTPYRLLDAALKRMYEYCFLAGRDVIDWVHTVTFGKSRVG